MVEHTFTLYSVSNTLGGTPGVNGGNGTTNYFTNLGDVTVEELSGTNDDILDDNRSGRWASDGSLIEDTTQPFNNITDALTDQTITNLTSGDIPFSVGGTLYSAYKIPMVDSNGDFVGFMVNINLSGSVFATTFVPDPNEEYTADWTLFSSSALINSGTIYYDALITEVIMTCFTSGTKILTDNGEQDIENLSVGDFVQTLDNDLQEILWIGQSTVNKATLKASQNLLPIRIKAGAFGHNIPAEDLVVSQQHRILIESKIAMRLFHTQEVLIPAKKLLSLDGVDLVSATDDVTYFHILCKNHEIIIANGTPTETVYLGKNSKEALKKEHIEEIKKIFPDVLEDDFYEKIARTVIERRSQVDPLLLRHQKNNVSFYINL